MKLKDMMKKKDCFYLNLEIKAKVKKYKTKIDASFKAKIEGIEQSYNSELV